MKPASLMKLGAPFSAVFVLTLTAALPGLAVASTCSKKTAKQQIKKAKPHLLVSGDYIARVLCADFTGDGLTDMAFTKGVQGSGGVIGWAVFNANSDGAWKLALYRPNDYRPSLMADGSDIKSSRPIYKKNDPNCCPSGGNLVRTWHWNGSKYGVTKSEAVPDSSTINS